MAVQALEEKRWYKEALVSEAAMLSKFGTLRLWMDEIKMQREVREKVVSRLKVLLMEGQRVNDEYGSAWLKPRYLLGAVCNERHRRYTARLVLLLNEMGGPLRAALEEAGELTTAANTAVGGRRVAISEGSDKDLLLPFSGEVQLQLQLSLRRQKLELKEVMQMWKLSNTDQKIKEWQHLATAPEVENGTAFTAAACPLLHYTYIDMLFVGLSDNTPLVSATCPPPPTHTQHTTLTVRVGAVCVSVPRHIGSAHDIAGDRAQV
jgi:hypothetical protein